MEYQRGLIETNIKIGKLTEEYAQAYRKWIILSRQDKSMLAILMAGFEGSQNSREMQALASDKYCQFSDKLAIAEAEKITAKSRLDAEFANHESYRTLVSLQKAEAQIL